VFTAERVARCRIGIQLNQYKHSSRIKTAPVDRAVSVISLGFISFTLLAPYEQIIRPGFLFPAKLAPYELIIFADETANCSYAQYSPNGEKVNTIISACKRLFFVSCVQGADDIYASNPPNDFIRLSRGSQGHKQSLRPFQPKSDLGRSSSSATNAIS